MDTAPAPVAEVVVVGKRNRRLLLWLIGLPIAMCGLVFGGLVPLYSLLCKSGGSQNNPNNPEVVNAPQVATGRYISVNFESKVYDSLPVRFYAEHEQQRVEVGTDTRNVYHFENLSDKPVHFRPIHQVAPNQAAATFGMKVCFCFNDQEIEAGGSREFPVVYVFGVETDERVKDVTICYSLLSIVDGESKEASEVRLKQAVDGQGTIVTPRFKDPVPPSVEGPTP